MATTETCHRCVYAHFDLNLWARTLWSGFPLRPTCANRPGSLGVMREVCGGVCRNYREKPADPDAQAKRILLTNGMVAYVDAADYEEISRYNWHLASGGYAGRHEKHKLILMHRQIMNPPEGMVVDHIKGNRLDNTRARLRICTRWENAQNRIKIARAASRYHNVFYNKDRRKWVARIRPKGKWKQVGSFDNDEQAARAHDYAAVLYLDDGAKLNFPEEWPPERRAEVRATQDPPDGKGKKVETSQGKAAASAQPRATRAERRATKEDADAKRKTKSRRATGHKSRPATPKRPQRKTRDAKRTTKPRRATGHGSRGTTPKGPPTGRQR